MTNLQINFLKEVFLLGFTGFLSSNENWKFKNGNLLMFYLKSVIYFEVFLVNFYDLFMHLIITFCLLNDDQ